MKKITLIPLAFLFITSIIFSQKENPEIKYGEYFKKTRENVHLHLNKTTFLTGENLWFQAYIQEQNTEKLHPETSNLYVSLYDESGVLKDQHLIRIQDGLGKGNIKIDSTFTEKAYYIRASTKWMKNFKEDQSFSQKIIILKNSENKPEIVEKENFYDFQILPEGGHLLANTYNRVGILLKDANNKGIQIKKGVVKDKYGTILETFTTNSFGIGETLLLIKENEDYTFYATTKDNIKIIVKTPAVKKYGVALNILNDELNKKFILKINTNTNSLPNLVGQKYSIFVHNSRRFLKNQFSFTSKTTQYSFDLNKEILFKGINIITVFNEKNQPVLERMIYNDLKKTAFDGIKTEIIGYESDSLTIRLKNNNNNNVMLSASFLPEETKAYNPTNSIKSSFLLKPFVKGDIEEASLYFNSNVKDRLKNLDLLLLTQGWSKYDWNNIYKSPPKDNFKFEKGIDILMRINQNVNTRKTFFIESEDNEFKGETTFKENMLYKIENSYFTKNSTLNFAIKDGDNYFKIGPSITYSNTYLFEEVKPNHLKELKKTIPEYTLFPFLEENYILLEEIFIASKSNEKNSNEKNSNERNDLINWSNGNRGSINNRVGWGDNYSNWNNAGIPNPFGFNNFTGSAGEWESYTGSQVFAWNDSSYSGSASFDYGIEPDKSVGLQDIYVDLQEVTLPVGFAKAKEYYSPKYPSLQTEAFTKHGAIWWEPNIKISSKDYIEFKIANTNNTILNLFLEGINEEGLLLESNLKIPVSKIVLK
ncbi:hypothetical protein [Polaribacter sp. P097]|uniref:hypothetical protein n=1 Tax=Polaribacter sp. P097 TaxID=3117398 RepID=UPI002FDF226B